jgi:hypothetical protein
LRNELSRTMNHAKLLAVLLAAWCLQTSWGRAENAPPKEAEELVRMRQQYNQRREAALKPIVATYKQQLELLLKSLTQRGQLDDALSVRKELAGLGDGDSGQVDLRTALLQWKWSWTGAAKETDVFMDFREDGTVSHRGMRGTWSIVGPRDVKLVENGGRTFVLRFNAACESYKSVVGPELHGQRSAR